MHRKFTRSAGHRRVKREGEVVERQQLTGPVTLTVTIVHDPPSPTPPLHAPDPATATPLPPPAPLPTTTPLVVVSTSGPPSPNLSSGTLSTSVSNSVQSTIRSISTAKTSNIPNGTAGDDNTNNTVKLSGGAVAGIVIGCLVVLVIAVVLGLRKRTVQNRMKLRGMWAGSGSLKLGNGGGGISSQPDAYNQDSTINGEGMGFVGTQSTSFTSGDEARAGLGQGLPQAMPLAYGSDGVAGPPTGMGVGGLYKTVVVRSFVPTLPDELSISNGERLRVLQEFDDGWVECMNVLGEVGMVPVECFENGLERSGRGASLGHV